MSQATLRKPAKQPQGRPVGTFYEDSLPTRLSNLDVGESESKCALIPIADASSEAIRDERRRLMNIFRKATARAAERMDYSYTTETFAVRSEQSDHMVVIAVATRTA